MLLLLIPLSAPVDEFWHRWYGVERNDSIWIIWSPPHVMLVLSIAISLIVLLKFIKKDPDESGRLFFGSFAIAGILGHLTFLTTPVLSLDAHHLLGFYGAGAFAFFYVYLLLYSQGYFTGVVRAVLSIVLFTVLFSINFHSSIGPNIIMPAHPHPPQWIYVFAFLIPAFCLDLIKNKPMLVRGIAAGFLYGLIFYGASNMFIEPQFQYSSKDFQIAVLSSLIAGAFAGILRTKHQAKS